MTEDAVTLLRRLVACNTSNPPGNEAQAAAIVEEVLAPAGLECERIAKDPGRPNLVARLRGRGGGPSLAFLCHFDTVQARREDWQEEPFAGVERDGAIWGRGAVDMKSQLAAATVALAELARSGFTPTGDLMLIVAADEEVGSADVGIGFLTEERPDVRADFVVGEGAGERYETPDGPLYLVDHGVKCTSPATLRLSGVPGDASLAGNGVNALLRLAHLLVHFEETPPAHHVPSEVEPLLARFSADGDPAARVGAVRAANEALGAIAESLTTNVFVPTNLTADSPKNVVPDRVELDVYGATLPGDGVRDLEAELRRRFGPGEYELVVSEPQGGLTSPLDTPLYRAIEGFLHDRDPDAAVVPTLGYGFSDCHQLRETHGSAAYGFVPFRYGSPSVNLASKHGVDERTLAADVAFQADAALSIARALGSTG